MDYYGGEFMHFNVLKLEKRLKKLELLLNSTNDINKKIELSRDIRSLRIMINYVSGCEYKNPEEEKFFDDSLIDKNEELASFLNVYGWDIYKSMYFWPKITNRIYIIIGTVINNILNTLLKYQNIKSPTAKTNDISLATAVYWLMLLYFFTSFDRVSNFSL